MNNYESFKLEVLSKLRDFSIPQDQMNVFCETLDIVSQNYHIERQTTDIIVQGESMPATIKLFIAAKYVEHKSPQTLYCYTLVLKNFHTAVKKILSDITTNDVRVYFYTYIAERHVSNHTIETMRHVLNSYFSWCYSEGYIDKDPMKRIAKISCPVKPQAILDPVELEMIRDACKDIREKAIIDFLFSTGCRVSEMCNILKTDVDFSNRAVYIINGKGGKSRTSYINAECEVSLKSYLKNRSDISPYLFTHIRAISSSEGKISKKAVENIVKNISSRCSDISKNITPHVFRRTAATIALQNGMPIEQVKDFLGHSSLNTTLRYAKTDRMDVKRSHEKYIR